MRKKIILTLFVAVAITCSAFASVLQVGATGMVNLDATKVDESTIKTLTDVGKYSFGAEARVNLSFVQLNMTAQMNEGFKSIYGLMGAGVTAGTKTVNLALGIAAPYAFTFEEPLEGLKATLDHELNLRVGVNLNILFAGLGISYYVPTGVAMNKLFSPDIANFKPDFGRGKIAVSAMLNLL